MVKLTKQQQRKKKLKANKKRMLSKQHERNRRKKTDVLCEETKALLQRLRDKINEENLDHKPILPLYKDLPTKAEREKLLDDYDKKYGSDFDPEELLELIVDEIKNNYEVDRKFQSILDSLDLRWHQIQTEIKKRGFSSHAELMTPLIAACGFDLS